MRRRIGASRKRLRRRRRKPGCRICGEERFQHKPDSYYGRIEHSYQSRR